MKNRSVVNVWYGCAVMIVIKFKCYFVKKIKESGKQEIITPRIAFREQNWESMEGKREVLSAQ